MPSFPHDWSGAHSEWLLEKVCVSNILSSLSKHVSGNQCKEWALRPQELLLLLTPQEDAPLEDLDPICWRVNVRFVVDRTQDMIFLRDHFLYCPSCVEQWNVVVGLAPCEKCCKSCEQVGQWARVLEWVRNRIWKTRRVELNMNVDCGCQWVDIPPPVSQIQQLLGRRVHGEAADELCSLANLAIFVLRDVSIKAVLARYHFSSRLSS